MWNLVATDVYALFNSHVEKSTTWSCKTEGGGRGQGPFTQYVKKNIRFGRGWLPFVSFLQPANLSSSFFCDLLRFATLLPPHCVVASGFNYLTTSYLCQRRLISSFPLSSFQFGPPRQMNPLPQSKTSLYCFNFLYNLKLFQTLGLMYANKTECRKGNSKTFISQFS